MADVFQVAAYFLNKANSDDAGDLISNLKLQKLVYYAQGFSLAIFDHALFTNTIEAWQHGPVVPELYHRFKSFGSGAIETPDEFNPESLSADEQGLLDEVYDVYGQFSAWKLRNMTHDEPPWKDAAKNGELISQQSMADYFKTQLQ
ncbi:type II toxin-antitoxin system antitoxin SocA domain-containing protein [Salinisphaera sp. G21_0]|uniref:Panacea domain-containing protein n=1 Tax=Salinisphaera sp. G21_0 TaxID=2821094 RepID=UPI001ADC5BDF|nr:type II toxin-antitoxin system antitoxin SocA domain-containing protein [Salinisphaera sp. G21_0]MBO9483109.1 SocA family protein [Salinisphaera sp. G21_0]